MRAVRQQTEFAKEEGVLLKAFSLRGADEIEAIKADIAKHSIIILRVTPLAQYDVDELRTAVKELYEFTTATGGDIARLGDERIVITPPGVKIWRGPAA